MAIRYGAYLVRHWQLADGQERVEICEMTTGERHQYRSLAEACRWIAAHGSERPPPPQSTSAGMAGEEA